MRYYMARTDDGGSDTLQITPRNAEMRAMAPGDRVLFYQLRGEGDAERGTFVAWGEVDRLRAEGDTGVAHLKSVSALKRRVSFSELHAVPRRAAEDVQPVPADVFNLVLSKARR